MGKVILWSYDCETDSLDLEDTRIVTAALVGLDFHGEVVKEYNWVIDTGREMPPEPAAVHGWDTERMQAHGMDDYLGIKEIANAIWATGAGSTTPVVIYNAPFDTTVLDRNLRRHDLQCQLKWASVIDPLVIDKGMDKWRKGSRKLVDVAAHYGVKPPDGDAHEAKYDCILAARVALAMRPKLHYLKGGEELMPWLMEKQQEWKTEQSASFQAYLRSSKNKDGANPDAVVNPAWPMVPFDESSVVKA